MIGVVVSLVVLVVVPAHAWIWRASARRIADLGAPDDTAPPPVAPVLAPPGSPSGPPPPCAP